MSFSPHRIYKEVPPRSGFLFPSPLDDPEDIFKVGPTYQARWFSSLIVAPTGVLSWIDKEIFSPFLNQLTTHLTLAGYTAQARIINGRYVVNGPDLETPPPRVNLPACRMISLSDLIRQMEKRTTPSNSLESLKWIEFLHSNLPYEVKDVLRKCPKLSQLFND